MEKGKKPEIPQHTKWGIRITAVIILLITITIVRNCIGSFKYGVSTEQAMQQEYYELGYSHGAKKAQGQEKPVEPQTDNLLLRKLYRKGYRDGWDSIQTSKPPAAPGNIPEKENDKPASN